MRDAETGVFARRVDDSQILLQSLLALQTCKIVRSKFVFSDHVGGKLALLEIPDVLPILPRLDHAGTPDTEAVDHGRQETGLVLLQLELEVRLLARQSQRHLLL